MTTSAKSSALAGTGRDEGFRLAQAGLVFAGRRALLTVVGHNPSDSRSWEVLGLCSFAAGNVTESRQFWEKATATNPASPAAEWVRELSTGSVASALVEYRSALEKAASSQLDAAAEGIAKVREALPDFAPGGRLQGVIFAAQGKPELARKAWQTQLALVPDDPDLHRLLAGAIQPSPATQSSSARVRSTLWNPQLVSAAILLAIFVASITIFASRPTPIDLAWKRASQAATDSPGATRAAANISAKETLPASDRPPTTRRPTVSGTRSLGWSRFVSGRADFERGALAEAVPKLSDAVLYGTGSFYYDDALYSLAQAQTNAGDTLAGSATAARLLRENPQSIFANSVTVKLAKMSNRPLP
jgi:tetratricopeptide (TPR) repeat protein